MQVHEAVKNLKTIGSEVTVWENRLEYAKTEVAKQNAARDTLTAEIEKKSADFSVYISQRDAEAKKMRSDALAEKEKLESNKAEFQEILRQHQIDKSAFEEQKRDLEIQKLRHASQIQNVQEFVTAIRRAVGLLGI